MVKIFISHSSKDVELVSKLINLFRDALNILPTEIRCTSVDGYRLPAGANINEQLRYEVYESEVFVGVISSSSLSSTYVTFELGARWGAGKVLIPLLAPGMNTNALGGPLASMNALHCGNNAQLHQLVSDLAKYLKISLQSAVVYQRYIDEIMKLKMEDEDLNSDINIGRNHESNLTTSRPSDPTEFGEVEEVIKQHCEKEWPSDYRMKLYCQEQQRHSLAELQCSPPTDVPSDVFAQIRAKCASEWPQDYRMRLYCEQQQINSYRKLKP